MRLTLPVVALLSVLTLSLSAAGSGYHKVTSYPVPGEGGWDYLTADADSHRLYVSHATQVVVFDTRTGQKVGEIPDTPGVHGVAIAAKLGLGFVSAGRANSVVVFDLKSLAVKEKIEVGKGPDWIWYDEFSNRIFTCNGQGKDLTAIDAATMKVVGSLPIGGKPETAMTDGKGRTFVNIEDTSSIAVFDSKTLKLETTWKLDPCEEPTGLDIDRKNKRLIVGCGNKLMGIVDYTSGKVVATIPTGEGTDAAAFDPALGFAYTSNGGAGTMSVVHQDSADKYSLVENVPTAKGARTMAIDTNTHMAYLAKAEYAPAAPAEPGKKAKRATMIPGSMEILVLGR
jgi:DNA-binding beta-propeller fold protein YncE